MDSNSNLAFGFDDEKAALVKKTSILEEDLERDFDKIKLYAEAYGKKALIIGGSLLATYLLVKVLTSGEDEEEEKTINKVIEPERPARIVEVLRAKEESPIVRQIKNSISLFLISIAKQKLLAYLEKNRAKGE